jgi:very-short-patch-repair endonuclease
MSVQSAPADFIDWLRERGGVAHSRDAVAAGYSGRQMAAAVAAGAALRVRRSWLLLPGTDPRVRRAVAAGGRLTCVSAAAKSGLWVPAHETTHVAVDARSSRHDRTGLVLHWSSGPVPTVATQSEDPLVNVLFHIARCLPAAGALTVWESAIRKKVVSAGELRHVRWGSTRARALCAAASSLSDSGIETIFVGIMRAVGVRVLQQVRIEGHAVDGLIGERLVIQIDGFAHHSAAPDRRRDIAHDARLALRGYTVLRFDYAQVMFEPEYVRDTVLAAIAQGLHLAR